MTLAFLGFTFFATLVAAVAYAEGRDTERFRIEEALRDLRRHSVHRHRIEALTAAIDLTTRRARR